MSGDIQSQLRLILTLEAYESAERACQIVQTEGQWKKADALYLDLLSIALACGFEPGGAHAHLTTYEWATARAATLKRVFPNHVAEKRRAA